MTDSLIPFTGDAPPPLDPLTNVVISPANIAAEQRQKKAQVLSAAKRRKFKNEIKRLERALKAADYPLWAARRRQLNEQLTPLAAQYYDLKQQLEESPDNEQLLQEFEAVKQEIAPLWQKWRVVEHKLRVIQPHAQRRATLTRALQDHDIAIARNRAEKETWQAMVKESKIYARLIIDKWSRLGFHHRWTKGNKTITERVKFARVDVTLDAIYLKVDASYKTLFGGWKTNLPDGIYIASQLLAPDTLTELSIACQRQVSGTYNTNGGWVVVHRLDSHDGLMNFVDFGAVQERYPEQYRERLPICVGVGLNRSVQWIGLADYPHWLIGGYTKSGKSNLVNVGICTLISRYSPKEIRLVLIDLKGGLEFSFYEDIPHLHGQIVDSIEKVAQALAEAEAIMNQRFGKFKPAGAKYFEQYHLKRPYDYMPRILIVFDEVASVAGTGDLSKQIMASLGELTRKGRAVGIHVWLCTQRPDATVLQGQVKNNLAVRISGRMSTTWDSMTILGNSTAKSIADIPGRMVMQLGGDPQNIQTPYLSEEHLREAIAQAKAYSPAPDLEIPEGAIVVHQQWTVERMIDFAITHMNGMVSGVPIFNAINDGSISRAQVFELMEKIWAMPQIEHEGQIYTIQAKGRSKFLVSAQNTEIPKYQEVPIGILDGI